ncbi:9090_t:CDS:2 [Scutellospora calospora]|uniref:9090_t:CDS:1 n=1 Tax=Scutellospora calospora TaxID=85575 RepID=A0ACA9LAW8_9GLOM|nr:9090_t:CDS:2 [Scutellospora calospora]
MAFGNDVNDIELVHSVGKGIVTADSDNYLKTHAYGITDFGIFNSDGFLIIIVAIIQGLLFSLDGFVTSLLKSPFQQMCYAINLTEGISNLDKDYIIARATESNEHCKETLKKFGILTITGELLRVFIKQKSLNKAAQEENGPHAN